MIISDKIELQNYKRNLIYFALQTNNSRLLEEINTLENNKYKPRKEALLVESKINVKNDFQTFNTLIEFYFNEYNKKFQLKIQCYLFGKYFDYIRIKDFLMIKNIDLKYYKDAQKYCAQKNYSDKDFLNALIRFKKQIKTPN